MKYLLLPLHLIKFWYLESLIFFTRTWKNLILYLEEDLAVFLMWRLLFVPLFHDATIVGRILSIIFRTSRIVIGLFAFAIATLFLLVIAIYWYLLPVLAVLDFPPSIGVILFLSGVGLFAIHVYLHPHKKIWQVSQNNFWLASEVKKDKVSLVRMVKDYKVKHLLSYLELQTNFLPNVEIRDIEGVGLKAFELAKKTGSEYIGSTHFFVAAIQSIPNTDQTLLKLGLNFEDFVETLDYLEKRKKLWRRVFLWDEEFTIHHLKGVNRGWLGVPTPQLDMASEDMTKKAAKVGFVDFIGGKGVVEETVDILSQESRRNVCLVGPPGSGKSTLVHHLAKQIVAGDAPPSLATKRLVALDLTRLLSGITTEGELAERVKNIFEEVTYAQNIILVVEEIHNLGLGEAGANLNLYSLMLPYLESSQFQFLATTEPENYSRILEKNGAFARLFTKIEIPPATTTQSLEILEQRALEIERKRKISVSVVSMKVAVELARKLIHDRVLPDSALTILEEAETRITNGWITKQLIQEIVSNRVKVPVIDVGNLDKDKLLNLERQIHQRLIDQDEAVKAVSDSLRRSAAGLREGNRPIGSFLFVGPTGVGKTELAKTLSESYFKDRGVFIRYDMSEYQNPESVSRLIGSNGEGGLLTEEVRNKPYALILLDEFEKADPKILTLFLQVLDDGRLTDGAGRLIDFTNTIIIATSNAASLTIAKVLEQGQSFEELDKKVNEEILQTFKPELINRFDDVVIFKPLSQQDLQKVVKLKIAELEKRLKEQGYLVEFDEGLIADLAKKGFDPVLGARPLRRLIQDTLEARLSRMILENKLMKGQNFVADSNLLVF